MAIFHVNVGKILKGKTLGGATGFAQYLARAEPDHATQHARYLSRESQPAANDLDLADHANLPAFARQDPARFFTLAERYERKGGLVARTYEISLPRELDRDERRALAADIRQTFFANHPLVWAIHNPQARDGQDQPHMHVMVSERVMDGLERSPQQFFRRAALRDHDPASGGARKDERWKHRDRLIELRAGIALLTNAALERAGHTVIVDPRPLKDRGYRYNRAPEREQTQRERFLYSRKHIATPGWQQTIEDRERLHRDFYPYEQGKARQFWAAQKQREGLQRIDREAMVAHVHARFWSHAQTRVGLQRTAMEAWWASERAGRTQERTPERTHAWIFQRETPDEHAHPNRRDQRTRATGRGGRDDGMQQGVSVSLQRDYEREKGL